MVHRECFGLWRRLRLNGRIQRRQPGHYCRQIYKLYYSQKILILFFVLSRLCYNCLLTSAANIFRNMEPSLRTTPRRVAPSVRVNAILVALLPSSCFGPLSSGPKHVCLCTPISKATTDTPVARTAFTRKKGRSSNCARNGFNLLSTTCFCDKIAVPGSLGHRGFVRGCLLFCVPCWRFYLSPPRAQHAVHRREGSEGKSNGGSIAGAWATREDLLETKKVCPHLYCCRMSISGCVVLHASYPLPIEVVCWYRH